MAVATYILFVPVMIIDLKIPPVFKINKWVK
jgi:hypothetical protein